MSQFNEENLSLTQRNDLSLLRSQLKEYIDAMSPNVPVKELDGAQHQRALYHAFMGVLRRNGQDFVVMFSELLNTIAQHRVNGAFHERYNLRFMSQVNLSAEERRQFETLMVLFTRTANPATRQLALQQFNMNLLLKGFDQPVIDKIISFFQI